MTLLPYHRTLWSVTFKIVSVSVNPEDLPNECGNFCCPLLTASPETAGFLSIAKQVFIL